MQSINRAERRRSSRQEAKRIEWATLEEFARLKIQGWLQRLLEEEVTELLGRQKSERRAPVDSSAGYRNGHGKPRRLGMTAGTITVRRPRVRDLEERFESRILPLFVRRTQEVRIPTIPNTWSEGRRAPVPIDGERLVQAMADTGRSVATGLNSLSCPPSSSPRVSCASNPL